MYNPTNTICTLYILFSKMNNYDSNPICLNKMGIESNGYTIRSWIKHWIDHKYSWDRFDARFLTLKVFRHFKSFTRICNAYSCLKVHARQVYFYYTKQNVYSDAVRFLSKSVWGGFVSWILLSFLKTVYYWWTIAL